jgi:hypothetical protein
VEAIFCLQQVLDFFQRMATFNIEETNLIFVQPPIFGHGNQSSLNLCSSNINAEDVAINLGL